MAGEERNEDARAARARSYDPVAADYARVNAPRQFDAPGRELVAFAAPGPAARVLDVGAGTGAVAAARIASGATGGTFAVDPSATMLEEAGRRGVALRVAGALPDLPFADAAFDTVLSAFVMSHLDDPDAAAREMARVLRTGGTLALSAWAVSADEYAAAWASVVREFVSPARLEQAVARVMPDEERFARPGGLSGLISGAGFVRVREETRVLAFALTGDEYVTSREVAATGRALRALISPAEWDRCAARARAEFTERFPGGVRYRRGVHFAAGERA